MKYTKTVPYFKKGDKIDKAAKNLPKKQKEAILKISSTQKEQERKDKLSSVGAGFRKPTAEVIAPVDTRSVQIKSTVGKKAEKTRGQAFQEARKRGDSEFLWKGARYHTRTAEEEAKRKANAGEAGAGNAGTDVPGQSSASRKVSLGNRPKTRIGIIPKYVNDSPYELSSNKIAVPQIPSNYVFPTPPEITEAEAGAEAEAEAGAGAGAGAGQSFIPRTVSLGNGFRSNIGLNSKYISPLELSGNEITASRIPPNYVFPEITEAEAEPEVELVPEADKNFLIRNNNLLNGFTPINKTRVGLNPKYIDNSPFFTTKSFLKSGGTINKFQRGTQGSGITRADLPTTSKWNIFGFQPNSAKWFPTDRDLPKGQTEEVSRWMHRNKDITTLRRPRPYYTADQPSMYNSTRTINWDNNTPVDTTYTYGNKVIQPNTIDHERYKAAFAGGDRALLQNIGKRQQGGAIQQQGVDKEALVADFVVRYLKTMGVPEEAMVTPEGSVNPEYEKELTAVITEIDSPEFWLAYQSSPDEVVTQVVRERNPNAVTMARKGTKLKRLSQLRIYKK